MAANRSEPKPVLLALLEQEERQWRWLSLPQAARRALVTELARLMTATLREESADERSGTGQGEAS